MGRVDVIEGHCQATLLEDRPEERAHAAGADDNNAGWFVFGSREVDALVSWFL